MLHQSLFSSSFFLTSPGKNYLIIYLRCGDVGIAKSAFVVMLSPEAGGHRFETGAGWRGRGGAVFHLPQG